MGLDRAIDITTDQRKTLLALIKRHLPNTTAWVYGSRVKWTSRPQSDLDLVVFTTHDQDRRVSELREAFEESNLPFRVDLFVWDAVPEHFRKQIEADHVVLVEKEGQGKDGEWTRELLGELTENFDAVRVPIKQADRRPGPYPYYGASGIVDNIDDYLFNGDYLLIAEDGENLRTRNTPIAFLANGKFWVNNHAHIVRGNHKANTRYLMYALSELDISGYLTGSTMPKLTQGNMNRISLLTPPPPEQRAIAHVLGTLDDKIELNRRMNETLEAMSRALFKSWFIDFDPVRAKMAGRDPGLPQHLADLFPDRFVDSELGPIPEGWEVSKIGQIADVIDCLHSKKPERRAQGEPLLQLWNIRDDGLLDMADTYFIDDHDYEQWVSRMEAVAGDCVITNVGRVGAVAQVPVGLKAALGRNMTGLRCKVLSIFPTFLIECLLSQAMRNEISLKMDSGTILESLNVRNIPKLRFVAGTRKILSSFEQRVRPLRARMEQNLLESRTLVALRDTLLPKLISGEIRIRKADIQMETIV